MEGVNISTYEMDGLMMDQGKEVEEREEWEDEDRDSTEEEEMDEDKEPEPPPIVRRKVSFADAFGLNLVSIKEFDTALPKESKVREPPESVVAHTTEEYYLTCLFMVPSDTEELDRRLQEQMLELESIGLLPGTTTLRGIIRVVNLCYSKSVHVRLTLDGWRSHFDLLAEYMPGSSDKKTDRFTFIYQLVPPQDKEGIRLEFCLRYETSVGTFWANNGDLNYVLLCNQKVHFKDVKVKEQEPEIQENNNHKSKRSCLKANRRGSTEEKMSEATNRATVDAEAPDTKNAVEADRKKVDSAEIHSILYHEEHKPLVDHIRTQRRASNLAHAQNHFTQREQESPKPNSVDSAYPLADHQLQGLELRHDRNQPMSSLRRNLPSSLYIRHRRKKQAQKNPQILTYHQIPLLTLDWSSDKAQQRGALDVDDIWTGGIERASSKASGENMDNTPSVSDIWEAFLSGMDENIDGNTSVCDIWQSFLNGPGCGDHSGVPESEWLQTAASVSPSKHKEKHQIPSTKSEHQQTFQEETDKYGLTADWPAVYTYVTPLDNSTPDTAVSGVESAYDASQKSEASSITDTLLEFDPLGSVSVSGGSIDSWSQWHKHVMQDREGKIVRAEGEREEHEPYNLCQADLVTSSGDTGATEMTAMPESENASMDDKISKGVRPCKGFSFSEEEEVTGTMHNAMDDTLAFRGTISQQAKEEERSMLFPFRQNVEECHMLKHTEKKVYQEEEIFRPQEIEETEISQRNADEKKYEEFRLNQNKEKIFKEKKPYENEMHHTQSHMVEFQEGLTHEEEFIPKQISTNELKFDELEFNEEILNQNDSEKFSAESMLEFLPHIAGKETKKWGDLEVDLEQVTEEEAQLNNDKASTLRSPDTDWFREKGDASLFTKAYVKQPLQTPTDKEMGIQNEEGEENDLTLTQREENVDLKCSGIFINRITSDQNEEDAKVQVEEKKQSEEYPGDSITANQVLKQDQEQKMYSTEMTVSMRNHTQENSKSQEEKIIGVEIMPVADEVRKRFSKKDILTELHQPPELSKGLEEVMSQRKKDKKVSGRKLKMEVMEELMGDTRDTEEETKNSQADLKEQGMLVEEIVRSQQVKCNTLSEASMVDEFVAHELRTDLCNEMFGQRASHDLDEGVSEDVLVWRDDAHDSMREMHFVEEMGADTPDVIHTKQKNVALDEDLNEIFDSGVFSLIELPTDPNLSTGLNQDFIQTSVKNSEKIISQSNDSCNTTVQTATELPTNQSSTSSFSECFNQITSTGDQSIDLSNQAITKTAPLLLSPEPTLNLIPSKQPTYEPDFPMRLHQNPLLLVEIQENLNPLKDRSIYHQEMCSQLESHAIDQQDSSTHSTPPTEERPKPSTEKFDQAGTGMLVWWSVLCSPSHISRVLISSLLVAVFFVTTLLYDFPACCALYTLSLCWWCCQWRKHRMSVTKGMSGYAGSSEGKGRMLV